MQTTSPLTGVQAGRFHDAMSLDIGAGDRPRGKINVDIRPLPSVDVVCHALSLPFKDSTFGYVFLSHVIEHFRYRDAVRLLREVGRVLKEDGRVEIWTPNFQALGYLRAWIVGGTYGKRLPLLYPPLSGDQDYEENTHLSHWSLKLLRCYIASEGFEMLRAESKGTYRGFLLPLRVFVRIFRSRGGDVHVLAAKRTVSTEMKDQL